MKISWLVPSLALAALAAGCGSSSPSGSPPATTALAPVGSTAESPPPATMDDLGDSAVWRLESVADVTTASTTFTALVTRLGCNGGTTGEVLEPIVDADDTEIVVTFFVAPVDGDRTCPANDEVSVEVLLDEPVGERRVLDGACRSGAEASSTSFCAAGAARWEP